jgi:hypothetical protein
MRDFFVALFAVERLADHRSAAFGGLRPRAALPGRVVADMLGVSTGEVGDPVGIFVLVEAGDGLKHALNVVLQQKGRAARSPLLISAI